jgi:hypothetical protein
MKTQSLITSAIVALGSLTCLGQDPAPARSTGQVSLRANVKNVRPEKGKKQDEEPGKPKSESVTKALEVQISAAKTITGPLKVTTFWYGRDQATKDAVLADKLESDVELDASHNAKLALPPYTFTTTTTPASRDAEGKSVKASTTGSTYYGWVIRAYEGSTLVGEVASSPPLLKVVN